MPKPGTSPDDSLERLLKHCVAPKARGWRKVTALRLWNEYLDGVNHPQPKVGRIELGRVFETRKARLVLAELELDLATFLDRHAAQDYGDATFEDVLVNEDALRRARGWLLSAYLLMPSDKRIVILTKLRCRTFVFTVSDLW